MLVKNEKDRNDIMKNTLGHNHTAVQNVVQRSKNAHYVLMTMEI